MTAFVRVCGPPNGNFLVGYPGISATLPRIEGKVEIRPAPGIDAPINISLVTICLQRRETIHPSADSVMKKNLAAPRKEVVDVVGKEMLLFRSAPGRENDRFYSMDLPFVVFIPFGRGGGEQAQRIPPASVSLASRTAETYYEVVVLVQQGSSDQRKWAHPVQIQRYDNLSTFGMFSRTEFAEMVTDHLVTLGIILPRWSYGPLDPIDVQVTLKPNLDWLNKAKRVTIKSITIGIEEEITYNHEGDEPQRKVKTLAKNEKRVNLKLPETGFSETLGLIFPSKDIRDSDGVIPRGKQAFPMYCVNGFTTSASLYKIEFFLTVKASLSSARDILIRQRIVVCPIDHKGCREEMIAIEQAAKDASSIRPDDPMLPAPTIVRPHDYNALHCLGLTMVGHSRKPLIE